MFGKAIKQLENDIQSIRQESIESYKLIQNISERPTAPDKSAGDLPKDLINTPAFQHVTQKLNLEIEKLRTELIVMTQSQVTVDNKQDQFQEEVYQTV